MAATVTTDRLIGATTGGGPGPRNGNGFHKSGGGDEDAGRPLKFSPARYRIGVWVAIGSILMLFVALSSSYIVRSASGDDWRPIVMPRILWLSTAIILVSSLTMEVSRRSLKASNNAAYGRWLGLTLLLGLGFLSSQIMPWRHLCGKAFTCPAIRTVLFSIYSRPRTACICLAAFSRLVIWPCARPASAARLKAN